MAISYNKLWKYLIDRNMKKQDLKNATGISWGVITKLSKYEAVSMSVLIRICNFFCRDIGDIMELRLNDTEEA